MCGPVALRTRLAAHRTIEYRASSGSKSGSCAFVGASFARIAFLKPAAKLEGTIVAVLGEGDKLPESLAGLDRRSGGHITRAMKVGRFEGKKDQSLDIMAPAEGVDRVILMGAGKAGSLEKREVELGKNNVYLVNVIKGLTEGDRVLLFDPRENGAGAESNPGSADKADAPSALLSAPGASGN